MRASGSTAVASTITRAAPPTARLPRWTKCQSFAWPSTQEYWHIGETTTRLRRVTSRSWNVSNKPGMVYSSRKALVHHHGAETDRSEEHTSELQSRLHLVCRLLLEKKKKKTNHIDST